MLGSRIENDEWSILVGPMQVVLSKVGTTTSASALAWYSDMKIMTAWRAGPIASERQDTPLLLQRFQTEGGVAVQLCAKLKSLMQHTCS